MVKVGEFSYDGNKILRRIEDGFEVWEAAHPAEAAYFRATTRTWFELDPAQETNWINHEKGWSTLTVQEPNATNVDQDDGAGGRYGPLSTYPLDGIEKYLPNEKIPKAISESEYELYCSIISDQGVKFSEAVLAIEATKIDTQGRVTYRGYTPNALNVIRFFTQEQTYDPFTLEPITDPDKDNPWTRVIFVGPAISEQTVSSVTVRLRGDDPITLFQDNEVFNLARHKRDRGRFPGPVAGNITTSGGSKFMRAFWAYPVTINGKKWWDCRVLIYLPDSTDTMYIGLASTAYDETKIPVYFVLPDLADYDWQNDAVGARKLSRLLWASDEPLPADLNSIADVVDATVNKPVSSKAVANALSRQNAVRLDDEKKIKDAVDKINNLEANPLTVVDARESTIFNGQIWQNQNKEVLAADGTVADTGSRTLPATKDLVTAQWLTDHGFVQTASAVTTGADGAEIFISTTDLEGVTVDAKFKGSLGLWKQVGKDDVIYQVEDGKWKVNTPPLNKADVAAIAKAEIDKLTPWDEPKTQVVIDKQRPWNFTTRDKVAPVVYFKNHGKAANTTLGSIIVDKGATWTKADALVFYPPAVTFGTGAGQIAKGKDYVIAAAVKTADYVGTSSLSLVGQQGNSFGTDLPNVIDGDWTVIRKEFNVPVANINTFFNASFGANAGDVQGPVYYQKGSHEWTWGPYQFRQWFKDEAGTYQEQGNVSPDRFALLEAKLDSTAPVTLANWPTRAVDPAALVLPDRNGVSFFELKATLRDGRPNVSGGLMYPSRVADVVIPKTAFIAETLAGWEYTNNKVVPTGDTTIPGRKTFGRQYTWAGVAYWFYIQWEFKDNTWYIWFQGWHSNKWNEYTSVTAVEARYAADAASLDPGLAPLLKKVDAEAIYAKKVDADAAYAKKSNLAKRFARTRVWSAAIADLAITGGSIFDNTASNAIPLDADINALVFSPIVSAAPATVTFTIQNLTIGQKYELIIKEGAALGAALTLSGAGVVATANANWRTFKQFFVATATSYTGSYQLTASANVQGPALYTVPGLYVDDANSNQIQVVEPADIPAIPAPASLKIQNSSWFDLASDFAYERPMPGAVYTSLYCEFSHPLDATDIGSLSLSDFTTSFSASGFYGTSTRFINTTMPASGRAVTIVVSRDRANTGLLINVTTGGASRGRLRNVILNGIPADTIGPKTTQEAIDAATLSSSKNSLRLDNIERWGTTAVELTGTTAADAGVGVGVLTTVAYTVPAGKKIFNHSIEIQASTGWWYKSTFNPSAESAYKYREARTTTGFVIFTSPDTGVSSVLNGRPYRIAITLVNS